MSINKRYLLLLALLAAQSLVVIVLQLRVNRLQQQVQSLTQIQINAAKGLEASREFECNQLKINYYLHKFISGDKPYYRPLPIPEECK